MAQRPFDQELAVYRFKWQNIFNGLVQIINSRESQFQTLLKERKLLEERIKTQLRVHESDVAFFEDRISQMNDEITLLDVLRVLDSSKLDLAVGFRKKEALLCKLKLDQAEGDLAVFGEYCSGTPDSNTLEDEVKRLKLEYSKLLLEKKTEASALLDEKKLMESDLSNKLKTKEDELRIANGKIVHLLATMEKIQASNAEKDVEVAKLRSGIEENDTISRKRGEEITRSGIEPSEDATNSGKGRTRSLNRKAAEIKPAEDDTNSGKGRTRSSKRKAAEFESSEDATNSGKGRTRSSKRKAAETEPSGDATPKLFSSRFKIPRLKKPS